MLAVTTQHMCGMGGDLFALVSTLPGMNQLVRTEGFDIPALLESAGFTVTALDTYDEPAAPRVLGHMYEGRARPVSSRRSR